MTRRHVSGAGSDGTVSSVATLLERVQPILDLTDSRFTGANRIQNMLAGSGAWSSANKAYAVPFQVRAAITVYQLGWLNGSGTMTDHVDMGIYTSAFAKVVSTGSVARTGVSVNQWVDIADTVLTADTLYHLVIANDGTTANQHLFHGTSASAIVGNFLGHKDSADALFPLPDPLTNMVAVATLTRIPSMFMALRAVA